MGVQLTIAFRGIDEPSAAELRESLLSEYQHNSPFTPIPTSLPVAVADKTTPQPMSFVGAIGVAVGTAVLKGAVDLLVTWIKKRLAANELPKNQIVLQIERDGESVELRLDSADVETARNIINGVVAVLEQNGWNSNTAKK